MVIMDIGVSTACLYPNITENSFQKLINIGFKTFEIFLNSPSELENDFIIKLKNMADNNNCKIKSIHPFSSGMEPLLLFSNYYRRFKDGLKFYEKYFYCAEKLGAKILVLHGGKNNRKDGISSDEYFERFLKLADLGEKYGIILAHENVNQYICQHIDFILKMNAALDNKVKYVFDIKQSIRAGHDPIEMCKAMGKNIVHVHINDNSNSHDCLLPGAGTMDYNKIKNLLDSFNYNGDIIIEVYRNNFKNLNEIKKSEKFLNTIFN